MRVRPFIGMFVMSPVYSDPASRGILDAAQTKNGKGVLQPFWTDDAAMSQHTVEAQADPERAEYIKPQKCQGYAGPAKEPGHERKQCDHMDRCNSRCVDPG